MTWLINYDSKPKFFASIGLGVIVGAFIIFLIIINSTYDKIDAITQERVELLKLNMSTQSFDSANEILNERSTYLTSKLDNLKIICTVLILIGMSSLTLGLFYWRK